MLRWLWKLLSLALFALIATLLVSKAMEIDWPSVWAALRDYDAGTLLVAAAMALGGHAAAACYDLVGKRYSGHDIANRVVLPINFTAYAFAINLGALIGGWGLRARLYSRYGLAARQIARVIGMAVVTNWSGFILLLAIALLWPLELPLDLRIEQKAWRNTASVLLILVVIAYLLVCTLGHRRRWRIRVRRFDLAVPSAGMALQQLALSCLSWTLMVATLHELLPDEVPFAKVMVILFVGSLVGAMTHIPGSVGVLEASVVWMFGADADHLNVLAAVLAYRALYYFVPLAVAALALAVLEGSARMRAEASSSA